VITVKNVFDHLNKLADIKLAEKWDNVGLMLGDFNSEVKNVLICLDVTTTVVNEAIKNNIDLIISHHPLIFKPLKSLNFTVDFKSNIIKNLVKNALEISVQGISCALIYAGKAGVWLSSAANSLKNEAQRAKLSRINEEQAKFEGLAHILPEKAKDIVIERLKAKPEEVEFTPIFLAKKQSFYKLGAEYFYDVRAKFNGFLYDFKIGAINGEILNLKIKSQI